jgi:hypothetical protein
MAGRKITQLPTLTTPTATDKLVIVDVSDTSESPQGTSKQIAVSNLGLSSIESTTLDVTIADGVATVDLPYKVYSALITQTDTNAPVATVLENTLGVTMTWSRVSEGLYRVTAGSGIFTTAKTWTIMNNANLSSAALYDINRASTTVIEFSSVVLDAGSPPYVMTDDIINALSLEIRVYA